jgi:A/G-specific adenine glycosylase
MELGALVCTPMDPGCARCPVAGFCDAHSRGVVARFPEVAPRRKVRSRRDLAVAFFAGSRVLMGKRRDGEVWGGLWELPRVTLRDDEADEDAVRRLGRELLGCAARSSGVLIARTKHTVMNERIELRVFEGSLRGEPRSRGHAEIRWVSAGELEALALPSPQRRVASPLVERISARGR